tara:strand:- start:1357 stop:2214 length:858 start_codon:yes stop_codon:yes gene_type:complete
MEIAKLITQSSPDRSNRLTNGEAERVETYLRNFGYLDDVTDPTAELPDRIKAAQQVLNLPEDGEVGERTYKAMLTTPRCGCPDVIRSRAEAKRMNQWFRRKAKEGLTYHVIGYVKGLSEALQEEIYIRAWTSWENVCGLKMIRKRDENADIIIDASASRREEFGSAGNVLAWAYLPRGDQHTRQLLMKMDLAENWIDDPKQRGILMENVACHEFGHLLGLDHTQIAGELLFPTYDRQVSKPQRRYDIPQVVERYDEPTKPDKKQGEPDVSGTITIDGFDYQLRRG